MFCEAGRRRTRSTPGIWNPLPCFDTVSEDDQLGNVAPFDRSSTDAHTGKLPAVSWVAPAQAVSEHPPALVSAGQAYVTSVDQRDHAQPGLEVDGDLPRVGRLGRLLRPRHAAGGGRERLRPARAGTRDQPVRAARLHRPQTLSFDAYLKFIEDDFLGGARLDPTTDGRPDPRPTVRENVEILGNLVKDFDFAQKPRRPLLLPLHPKFS